MTTEESIVEARVLSKIDSDHFPILFSLPFSDVKRHKKDEMRTFRSRKNFDIDKMKEKLANINWSDESDDPEQSVESYNRKIFGIYNEMCPLVTRKVAQKGHPWYDGELKASKVVLKQKEKKWKFEDSSFTSESYQNYIDALRKYHKLLKIKRDNFLTSCCWQTKMTPNKYSKF